MSPRFAFVHLRKSKCMYRIIKFILFLFDPEKVHYKTTGILRFLFHVLL